MHNVRESMQGRCRLIGAPVVYEQLHIANTPTFNPLEVFNTSLELRMNLHALDRLMLIYLASCIWLVRIAQGLNMYI